MKEILTFLDTLMRNNNREWFLEHKEEYVAIQNRFNQFTAELIQAVGVMDPTVANLTVKDCTYRIYKDLRFTKDKLPYKTHMGAYLCPHGKKSGYAGYYFHLEPSESEYIGGNMLAAGLYNPTPEMLRAVRDRIDVEGMKFEEALKKSSHMVLGDNGRLSRVPKGFAAEHPFAEYLKLKDYSISMKMPEDLVFGKKLIPTVVEIFREAMPFNHYLNGIMEEISWY